MDFFPEKKLQEYEESLLKRNKQMRSLLIKCNSDRRAFIEPLESIEKDDWYVVSNIVSFDTAQDDYFDVILFSDCDLVSELRKVRTLLPKLKNYGRIYFDNMVTHFDQVLNKCIEPAEKTELYKTKKPIKVTSAILQGVFSTMPVNVVTINKQYIVFQKRPRLEPAPVKIAPILLPGLRNVGGYSCYMDSILFPMFLTADNYFDRGIIQRKLAIPDVGNCDVFKDKPKEGLDYLQSLQETIRDLAVKIRSVSEPTATCKPLKNLLKKCQKELMKGGQQDDSEFLIALMTTFGLEPTTITAIRAVSNNGQDWIETSKRIEPTSVVEITLPINGPDGPDEPIDMLKWFQRVIINDYGDIPKEEWPQSNDKPFRYSREKSTIVNSEVLILHTGRRATIVKKGKLTIFKNTAPVEVSHYIRDRDSGQLYNLAIVTIHHGGAHGGHYTCYFQYEGFWYHYDDTYPPNERVRVANWLELVNDAAINSSLYIYYKNQ